MLPLLLLSACGPIALGDGTGNDADPGAPVASYELGWPVDACAADFPDEGTGFAEGDVLGQVEMTAQTGETVKLHDFCNHVVYLEFGYFT